ncbi:MAG: hypothetical protein ACJ78Q_04850 [Chloroflexia bacterium]
MSSPTYTGIKHGANGQPIIWNKKLYLRMLAFTGALTVSLAAVTLLLGFGVSSFFDIVDLTRMPFALLSVGLFVASLVLLFWLLPLPAVRNVLETRVGNMAVLVLAVIGCVWVNGYSSALLRPQSYTSFASWPSLVRFAKHEAGKIDKEAEIKSIDVNVPSWGITSIRHTAPGPRLSWPSLTS